MAEVKQQFTKAKPGQSIWVGIVKQTWLEHLEPFASMEADPKRNNKPVSLSRQEWLASSVKELHSSREGSTTTIGVDAHVLLTASSACCSKKFGSSIRSSVFSYGPMGLPWICRYAYENRHSFQAIKLKCFSLLKSIELSAGHINIRLRAILSFVLRCRKEAAIKNQGSSTVI